MPDDLQANGMGLEGVFGVRLITEREICADAALEPPAGGRGAWQPYDIMPTVVRDALASVSLCPGERERVFARRQMRPL